MAEVIVLFEGYSKQLDDTTMDANCSCCLIKAEKNIIVDTMTAWDGQRIIEALGEHQVRCEDIDYVVCSHSHADHTGNNNLFLNAEHIVGSSGVHRRTSFYDRNLENEDYELCKSVKVMSTPGHTRDDVSVIVAAKLAPDDSTVRIAITGDLFEKEEDLENPSIWQKLGDPELRFVQAKMRSRVLDLVDYVVPGHGTMFRVTETTRELARVQSAHSETL